MTPDDIEELLDVLNLDHADPVAIDIETTGFRLYQEDVLRGFAITVGDDSWYLPITHPNSERVPRALATQVLRLVAQHDVICMHNSPFDRTGIALTFGVEFADETIWDTQTVDWLLNENLDHRLKEVGARLFGIDAKAEQQALKDLFNGSTVEECYRELRQVENARPKAEREKATVTRTRARSIAKASKKDWSTVSADDIAAYAMQDTELTLDLYHWQRRYLADHPEYAEGVDREFRVAGLAYRMGRTGVKVDPDRAAAALEAAEDRAAELQAMFPVNLKAPAQVAKLLYEDWGLPKQHHPKTGNLTTNKTALERLSYDPRVHALQEFRLLTKQIDAFYVPLLDRIADDGRIHPSWNAHRVVTGRWSCSGPNLQQVPKEGDSRLVFVPEPGFMFVSADLPNAELRVTAILADEPLWLAAFAAGRDLHQEMADAAGVPRKVAKTINFSALYGVKERTLSLTLAAGTGEKPNARAARQALAAYWKAIPRVKRLFDGVGEAWVRRRKLPIRPWPGRFRHIDGRFGTEAKYKALNSIVQGSVGEAVKDWLLELESWLPHLGGRIVAQVHDSVVLEVPADRADDAARLLQEAWDEVNPFTSLPWPLDVERTF